jgi:hypothetical protein
MHNIESIYFFIFVFTILVVLRNITKFVGALLSKDPKPMVYGNRELIFLGLSLSYLITFLLQ